MEKFIKRSRHNPGVGMMAERMDTVAFGQPGFFFALAKAL